MKKSSKAKRTGLLVAGVTALLGAILILWPLSSVELICRILGVCILIFGGAKLVGYFSDAQYRLAFRYDLVLGIFSVFIGLVLVIRPDTVISLVHILVGVYIIVLGVLKAQSAADARYIGVNGWWVLTIGAVISVVAGIVLVFFPFSAVKTVVRVIGAALIIEGADSFIATLFTAKPSEKEDISADYRDIS